MGDIKAITFDLWDTLVIDDSDEANGRSKACVRNLTSDGICFGRR
ncbi:MAG: hypothetical protein Ct9H300mP32_2250 [Verrucomicrobiota bacterium]|nr:MAG: hypothetical protein Ct9H300mP32_2250 [Verrucomicrobiota bacterium]